MGVPGYNRKLISLEQAIKTVIKDLNQKGVEEATGKSVSWFRKCSDPQDTERQIIHKQSLDIDIACLKKGLGAPMLQAHQAIIEKAMKDVKESEKVTNTLIDTGAKLGHLMEVVQKSMDPNSIEGSKISNHEKEKIYEAINDVEEKIANLKIAIDKIE